MSRKLTGSVLIIAGTTIGAGMLAIPIASAQLGYFGSAMLMTLCWLLMSASALVLLEVLLHFKTDENDFSHIAYKTLGRGGQGLMVVSFLAFIYALLSAYISGGASIVTSTLSQFGVGLNQSISGVLFLGVLGGFVYKSTQGVDKITRLLFSAQGLFFIAMLVLFMPKIDFSLLVENENLALWVAAPVVLTSFGFHIVLPSLVTYLGDEAPKLKYAIVIGSFIPLVTYLLWQLVILGTLPLQGELSFATLKAQDGSIGELVVMLSGILESTSLSILLNLFGHAALMTSFLGVSLAIYDFGYKNLAKNDRIVYKKECSLVLTYLPPFVFVLVYPNGFIRALAYGAVFEAILCILLPVMMLWMLRYRSISGIPSRVGFVMPGGKIFLLILFASSIGMIGLDIW